MYLSLTNEKELLNNTLGRYLPQVDTAFYSLGRSRSTCRYMLSRGNHLKYLSSNPVLSPSHLRVVVPDELKGEDYTKQKRTGRPSKGELYIT